MSNYKQILVAVDLTQDSTLVLERARQLADTYAAELSLVHVTEPLAMGMAVEVSSVDVEGLHDEACKHAREALQRLGSVAGIPAARLHNLSGIPAREIRELAKTLECDLVIMGGHKKNWFELMLGSTSSNVSHTIACDLLIVRIPEEK